MIQKSYEKSEYGKLYLIPTPIGNLDDITIRGINTLKEVDIIFAEDTRQTLNLLKYLNISKKVESCHKFSEMMHKDKIISILKSGKNVGYVTDRGTPLISDPGNVIVDYAIKENITVIALPGASALLPALNMSGISNERFLFYGFLNSKITIAREISKLYEEIIRDKINNIIEICDKIKGEIVIIVEGYKEEEKILDYNTLIDELINKGYSKKDAIKEIADRYNISKNKLYNDYIK